MNSLPNQKGKDAEMSSFARSASSALKKYGQENESGIENASTKGNSKYKSNYLPLELSGINSFPYLMAPYSFDSLLN